MRFLLSLVLVCFLASCAKMDSLINHKGIKNERSLFVIHVRADWCNTCGITDSPINSLEKYFEKNSRLDYVVFDQTNVKSIHDSLANAKKLGLGNLFEHERHTGEVLFVDQETKKVLTKVYGIAKAEKYKNIAEKLVAGESVPNKLATRRKYDLSKPSTEEALEADLLVVDIHHDMCGGCATTAPVFEDVAKKYRRKDEVCFMTFDLTTPQTVDQTRNLARSLGIESIYNNHKHTGEVLFIDAKNKRVLASLVTETDKGKYYRLIKKLRREMKA